MFKQYRKFTEGEFILVAGDCSQGGPDYNACQFMSKTKLDIPLVYHSRGVAAEMTSAIQPVIEAIYDVTKVRPMVCLERNNGGGSEMQRLDALNRSKKYELFIMPVIGQTDEKDTKQLGWNTTTATRPILLGDWRNAFDSKIWQIYDEDTIKEHKTFIINQRGKPEAVKGKNDDLVFGVAIGQQLYQRCEQTILKRAEDYDFPDEPHLKKRFY